MIQDSPEHEAELSDLLAMYDESLAAGDATTSTDVGLSEALLSNSKLLRHFEKMKDCLHLLESDRRQQQTGEIESSLNVDSSIAEPLKIGRFLIQQRLGSGGFGIVYLAEDPILKRNVALKIPRRETLVTPDLQQRFIRESQISARLTHRYLVPIYEAGQSDSISYQVMEYCAGGSLAEWVRGTETEKEAPSCGKGGLRVQPAQRRLPVKVAVELMTGLAEGVQYAHDQGILHRDLKPGNILFHPRSERESKSLSPDSSRVPGDQLCNIFQPMIADFGLAKIFDLDEESSNNTSSESAKNSSSDIVRTTLAGTPQYMAPEQFSRQFESISKRTDVYGLGAILYEILAGVPAFSKDSFENLESRIATELPKSLRVIRKEVPQDLEAICLKCLEKNVARRYGTAQELIDDLRAFQRGESVSARPWPWHEQVFNWTRRRPAIAALLSFSAVLLVALIGFGAWHLQQQDAANERLRDTVSDLKVQTEVAALARRYADTQTEIAQGQSRAAKRHSQRSQDLNWIARQREYAARMTTSWQLFQQGRIGEVGELLNSFLPTRPVQSNAILTSQPEPLHSEDVRDFSWRYLWAQSYNVRLLRGHDNQIRAAQLTPDGRTCYSVSTDSTVRSWNTDRGQLLETWSLGEKAATHYVAQFDRSVSRAIISRRISGRNIDEVLVWDLQNGRVIKRKEFAMSTVNSVAISADGKCAAIGGSEKENASVTLWSFESGETTSTVMPASDDAAIKLNGHTALAFSPDGTELVIGGHYAKPGGPWHHQLWRATLEFTKSSDEALQSSTPRIVDIELIKPMVCGVEHEIVYSADGQRIALSTGLPSIVQVWDVKQKSLVAEVTDLPAQADCLAFDESGTRMVMGIEIPERTANGEPVSATNPAISPMQHELSLWDIAENKRTVLPFMAQRRLSSVSPFLSKPLDTNVERVGSEVHDAQSRHTMVIGDSSGLISLWTPEHVAPHRDLKGHQPQEAWGLAFSPDSKRLYSVGDDACLRAWDMATLKESTVAEKHNQLTSCVAISADGQWIATGSYDDRVILWKTDSMEPHAILEGHTHDIKTLSFSPDSRILATAARDKTVRLWSVPDGQPIDAFDPDEGITRGIAFTAAETIVKGDADGHIITVGLHQAPQQIRDEGQEIHCLTLAPAGIQLPSTIALNLEPANDGTSPIQTIGNSELLLVGCKFGRFELIHLPTRSVRFAYSYPGTDIRTVAFSPDGQTFAVAGDDNAVHVWHTTTGQELMTFANLQAEVNQVAFSPDGQILAAALHDGTIRIWHGPKSDSEMAFR